MTRGTLDVRRFHARRGEKLRYWEIAIWQGMRAYDPCKRFWSAFLADAFYRLYRYGDSREVEWINSDDTGDLTCFEDIAAVFDIDPADVRRDVKADILKGRIKFHERPRS